VHHNYASGLWTDIDNMNTLYEGNQVFDNIGNGISHEISYDAVIRNNVLRNNGKNKPTWLWGSQILIQNSLRVEVYGNTVEVAGDTGNGISIISQNRGSGKYGPYIPQGNYIHHNKIIFRRSPQGCSGAVADYAPDVVYGSGGNRLDFNTYYVTDLNASHWQWSGYRNWNTLRTAGHERNGTLTTQAP
jgi:parallel beta-helix repeat protein